MLDFIKKHRLLTISVTGFIISRLIIFGLYVLLFKDYSLTGFLEAVNKYDANHYNRIVMNGYLPDAYNITGEAGWAFFPFYPLLVGGLSKLMGVTTYMAAYITGAIFSVGAAVFGGRYMELVTKDEDGIRIKSSVIYIILLFMGPFSFYLSIFYTEAPFLFFLTACFYYLEKEEYIRMGIFGALMSFTRNMGVFFLFVILIRILMKRKIREVLADPGFVAGVSMIPAGLFGFMYYLYRLTGDALAFVHVQVAWGRVNGSFLKVYMDALKSISGDGAFHAAFMTLGFFLTLIMVVKYKKFHEAMFALIILILPAMSVVDSMARYIFGGFVFLCTFSRLLAKAPAYLKISILLFLFGYELVLFNGWLYGAGVLT